MNDEQKNTLLEQFRNYLETVPEPDQEEEPEIDQMTLFRELAALKNEVHIESRQVKAALEEFRSAFSALDGANQELERRMHDKRENNRAQDTPLAMELIDIYDRIAAGLAHPMASPSLLERLFCRTTNRRLQGYFEGQQMLQKRMLTLLEGHGVKPIQAVGAHFAPQQMKAVGFKQDATHSEGEVLKEERAGFMAGEQCLRPAEVIVNKL